MKTFLDYQNWRYATKKFDATKKLSDEQVDFLKEALRLSSSSYGLQPYKVILVESKELREKIQPVAWGQTQIVDASHLFVLASETNFGEAGIDAYFNNMKDTRNLSQDDIKDYMAFMKNNIVNLPLETRNFWTAKQTYIALGNLLNAAAELGIDATPMEGFEPEKVNEILGLNELNLHATLIIPVGYRHEEDATQHYAKVRKSNSELFLTL